MGEILATNEWAEIKPRPDDYKPLADYLDWLDRQRELAVSRLNVPAHILRGDMTNYRGSLHKAPK
jgi:hypothetical protein